MLSIGTAPPHTVATVSVWSDSWLGCALATLSVIARCTHVTQADALHRWVHVVGYAPERMCG